MFQLAREAKNWGARRNEERHYWRGWVGEGGFFAVVSRYVCRGSPPPLSKQGGMIKMVFS